MNQMKAVSLLASFIMILPVIPGSQIDATLLKGAWTSHGGSFDFVIQEETILFEFDMEEHPYQLDGDTLVIQFDDIALGIQRKRVIRLTPTELELHDLSSNETTVFRRVE